MDSADIRQRFLDYFTNQGHTAVPSASLILDDPTLLFINAGMVPFKPYFLGEAAAPYQRAASVQKCVRTLDIDEVGKTTRHASFFQMCGNFSFGDYFKEDAIKFAWDLLTKSQSDGGYGFPEEKLWVTVYLDDDEGADIWHKQIGIPKDRIQRRDMADNFWSMGVPGPCGPCSEIYYDRGPEYGAEGGPIADESRYLEIWNLVFMQFERGDGPGKEGYPILGELPAKNIDTGMGLERMAALLQGVDNIYEIDTTRIILDRACELSGQKYGNDLKTDIALRVVADHSRTCAFMIADGVLPGNEGRGYVLRRILRRVVRNMRLLGCAEPAMAELILATVQSMAPQYPELATEQVRLVAVAVAEEESFLQTLERGTSMFDVAVKELKSSGSAKLSGDSAFALHDTFGFPIDLTLEMASEQGISVDEEGFRRLMQEQRSRAKADAQARKSGVAAVTLYRDIMNSAGVTEFTGYTETESEGKIAGLLVDGADVKSAAVGQDVEVVLTRTSFYAENGGQLGDHGRIALPNGAVVEVNDVQTPVPGLFVHRGRVISGELQVGDEAVSEVDVQRRLAISRAHTATHMVHKAFREALGETATQMGSENSPGRLRFDFPSAGAVPASVLADVEARVNEILIQDLLVTAEYMTQAQARESGAMALFGEKYGDQVRVVSVGDWAKELCGGTHTNSSGQLGVVSFLSESSIGAGVRRVEALVGADAYRFLAREHHLVAQLTEILKSRPEELVDRVGQTLDKLKTAEREIAKIRKQALLNDLAGLLGEPTLVRETHLYRFTAPSGTEAGEMRDLITAAKGQVRTTNNVLVGACLGDDKVAIIATTDSAARDVGVSASAVASKILSAIGGKGGGSAELAQGAGPNISALSAAFDSLSAGLVD
ncbi:MAG: alanine--tRNA ligase [Actinomycetales bacterium]|nr:alanine--tRNA ligase [Actinomycetales bacterium]